MQIYVKRTQPSNSARSLLQALGGRRLRDGSRWRPGENDVVICWGESHPNAAKVLNGGPLQNKLTDAIRLAEAGVATITISRTKPEPPPTPAALPDPIIAQWEEMNELLNHWPRQFPGRNELVSRGLEQFASIVQDLRQSLLNGPPRPAAPVVADTWLPRLRNHIGGRDLLNTPQNPDFWVKKEDIRSEYRVHSFLGSSIRAGKKVKSQDTAHEWIRSLLAGWKISYDGVSIRQRHRDIAHQAIKALGLHFGAVDIGEKADGSLLVLEVNRAPGLDGGTITAYASAVRRWIDAGYPETLPERA